MSNPSSSLFATSMPDIATAIMRIAEQLATGVCPSCGRHSLRATWYGWSTFALSCGEWNFLFDNQALQSRVVGPDQAFLPQSLLFALAAIRRLKSMEADIRQTILRHIHEGAAIQPGTLDVEIREITRRPITDGVILEMLSRNRSHPGEE